MVNRRRDVFDSLNAQEQQTVISFLANSVIDPAYADVMRELLWEIDYLHRPVSIETFLSDEYYFGGTCSDLHPRWREDLVNIFAPGSRIYELILTGAIGTGKCVVEGTLIPTARGMVPVEEITVVDQVHARTGLRQVTTVHDEGMTRILRVETKHGHILSGRPNHRVLVLVGLAPAWIALQDLKEGDCLLQRPTPDAWGPVTLSPQAGELLGWLIAEGSRGGENYYQLSLADSEVQHVASLADAAGPELGITYVRVYPHLRRVDITSSFLAALLKGARSWEKTIPSPVLCGGLPGLHGFLRGLFSGDGSIDHIGCCELTTASERLAQQVRTVFTALGLTVSVSAKATHYTYQGKIRDGRTAYRVRLVGPETDRYFCDNIGFVREDQQQRIRARTERYSRNTDHSFAYKVPFACVATLREAQPYYCKGSCPIGQSKTKTPRGKLGRLLVQGATRRLWAEILDAGGVLPEPLVQLARGALLFDTVAAVSGGYAHCYDLTVDGDPSYISDGFVSHNTTIACVAMGYKLYTMSCLRDAAAYYGLLPGSLIIYGIYSITKKQVGDAGYYKFRSMVDGSPYFRQEFPRNLRLDSKLAFKRAKIQLIPGCIAEGEMVDTPTGPMPIECLPEFDGTVLSVVNGRVTAVSYKRKVAAGKQKCLDLECDGGIIVRVSLQHRLAVSHGDGVAWKEAQYVQPGEALHTLWQGPALGPVLPPVQRSVDSLLPTLSSKCGACAIPQDQDVQGQGTAPDRRAEGVPGVQTPEAPGGLWNEEGPASWGDQDVLTFLLQGMQCETSEGLLRGPQGRAPGIRPPAPFYIGAQTTGEEALGAILRGEPLCDTGAYVIARRPIEMQSLPTGVEAEEQGEGAGLRTAACEEAPGQNMREGTSLGQDGQGACCSSRDGTTERGTQERVTGYAYAVGCRDGNLVLWRKVLLLWATPGREHPGSPDPLVSGWGYSAGEHCPVLPVLQLFQERHALGGVLGDPSGGQDGYKTGVFPHPKLYRLVVRARYPAGDRPCYDLEEAGPERCFFVNGVLVSNSRELHALGLDLFCFVLDEVNFMLARSDPETGRMLGQAYDLYHATHRRLMSRFMRPGGTIPGMMILISSRKHQTAFLETHLQEVQNRMRANSSEPPMSYVCDYPLWACKPTHRFTLPKFRVLVGDKYRSSRILLEGEEVTPGTRIEMIPGEFRRVFEENVDEALRDVAGVATFNVSPFISDRQSILDSYRPHLVHPFQRDMVLAATGDEDLIQESFVLSLACRVVEGHWVPRLNPRALRYIHLDMAETGDCAGMSMGHCAGMVRLRKEQPDGTNHVVQYPYIVLDFQLRIPPPVGGSIALWKIRSFVLWLRSFYNIALVSVDGWNSVEMRQLLEHEKVKAVLLSVDRTPDPYMSLRSAYFERRIAGYRYAVYEAEVLDLVRDPKTGKVDHPAKASHGGKGAKDVADATTGVVWHCSREGRFSTDLPLLENRDTSSYAPYVPSVDGGGDGAEVLPVATRIPGGVEAVVQQARMDRPGEAPTLAGVPGVSWDQLQQNVGGTDAKR